MQQAWIWVRAFRIHQWAKNLLVFVGPILGGQIRSVEVLGGASLLFVVMGILASATYIINDLFDLEADRHHPQKRERPFAAGELSVRSGAFASAGLLGLAAMLALFVPGPCKLVLAGYLILTLAYTLVLKRWPMLDVLILAGLYTLRILLGCLLLPDLMSPWLLTFSILFFLGLAILKRYAELEQAVRVGAGQTVVRGYSIKDLPLLLAVGPSSGLVAIAIFMIYLVQEQYPREVYNRPELLWLMTPILLLWLLRLWHVTVNGRMIEDAVNFALRDPSSLALGTLAAFTLVAARM